MAVLDGLERRHGVVRAVRFALAGGVGFLVNEAVVVLGVLVLYGSIHVPSFATSSMAVVGLDALALGAGATVAFLINERVTVRGVGEESRKGRMLWSKRWGEYQLASLLGNATIIVVQLSLLAVIGLSPVFGSAVGAVVSYPLTYLVAMHYVWRVRPFGD
jgi:putative flippase GtrA